MQLDKFITQTILDVLRGYQKVLEKDDSIMVDNPMNISFEIYVVPSGDTIQIVDCSNPNSSKITFSVDLTRIPLWARLPKGS